MKTSKLSMALALSAALTSGGCSTVTENPTVFPYQYSKSFLERQEPLNVVVAPFPVGAPPRNYLEDGYERVVMRTREYLKKNGHNLLPAEPLAVAWNNATRIFGDPYDPTTDQISQKTRSLCLGYAFDKVFENTQADIILFVDLYESQQFFSPDGNHYAKWDGVSRKPSIQGPDNYVTGAFNWFTRVDAVSIATNIFNHKRQLVFSSRGGVEITDAVDTRTGKGKFKRRKLVLKNDRHIDEGIQLSLHPWIKMQHYPAPNDQQ